MTFSLIDLDKELKHKNILVSAYSNSHVPTFFKQHREVFIKGIMYKISWFLTICYLKTRELTIPFSYVKQENTTNNAKMNLQFYNKSKEICCVLRIE